MPDEARAPRGTNAGTGDTEPAPGGPLRSRLRRLTSHWRPLPDAVVIGAQKSATTSLFRWLEGHPDVLPAVVKEVHFFDLQWDRGLGWYRSNFPLRTGQRVSRLAVEATPAYLFHPLVPPRVRDTLPRARLLAVLRNPVDRAYSHYQHAVLLNHEPLSFEAALTAEEERLRSDRERLASDPRHRVRDLMWFSYQARGHYAEQLDRWLALFPRDQLLVLDAGELATDPSGSFDSVQRFLGLPPAPLVGEARHHVHRYPAMEPSTRRRLVEQFRPHNERLYTLLGRTFDWDR